MKTKLFFLLFLTLGILTSCDKKEEEKQYENKGMLLGLDESECACCGGYIIKFDNEQTEYRTYTQSIENLNDNDFPIEIEFNWTLDNDCAGIMIIEVEDFNIIE